MQRVRRQDLPNAAQQYLDRRQQDANERRASGRLDVEGHWKSARQTQKLKLVLGTLLDMAGPRQRCMYCLDSHGSDIEHFRPKALAPQRMYGWSNMLLCCTHCGRLKGNQFPVQGRRPLLVDPSRENPWDHLDLDPATGNLSARFDLANDRWSPKGLKTVEVLRLDRREALALGYLKTLKRLGIVVQQALEGPGIDADALIDRLRSEDEHGLLGWCFSDRGSGTAPFSQLRLRQTVWKKCRRAFAK